MEISTGLNVDGLAYDQHQSLHDEFKKCEVIETVDNTYVVTQGQKIPDSINKDEIDENVDRLKQVETMVTDTTPRQRLSRQGEIELLLQET